jgi:hypothetical protein
MPRRVWAAFLAALVLGAGLGALAGFVATSRWLAQPLARLNLMTPVFVLDRAAVLRALPPEASREAIEHALAALRTRAERLAAEGYLVLDGNLVVAAPEDVRIRAGGDARETR